MTAASFRSAFLTTILAVGISLTTSCTVDQKAAYETGAQGSKTKKTTVSTGTESRKEKRIAIKEEKAEARAEAQELEEKELAEKEAADRKEEAREKALAARKDRADAFREEAEEKAKAAEIAARDKEKDDRKAAKAAAKHRAQLARDARQLAEGDNRTRSRGRGGILSNARFGSRNTGPSNETYVNKRIIGSLNPTNARIEIDISEQKARVFRTSGGMKDLAIETDVSTGKSGHTTPTGTFSIKEKLVAKRSSRYGRWLNSSGATIRSDGDSNYRPSGASQFVGASMPYWMRITGGIGMHIGYVPDFPASHGCIRVPERIQPLIFSKVGHGTTVQIYY